jgi:outer membrane immunogenic protein
MKRSSLIKLIASTATLLAAGGAALAADLPMKYAPPAPAPAPVLFNWTGFYAGLNAGIAWSNAGNVTISDPVLLTSTTIDASSQTGFIGGGQIGYNFQSGEFVGGLEADIQYASIGNSIDWGPYGRLGLSTGGSGEYFGTVRVRAGYAIDRTLLYLTGGLAYGGLNTSPLGGNATSNVGYALGGGVEYAFSAHWTAKLEALYVNLSNGSDRTIAVTNGGNVYPVRADAGNGGGIVRVGVNYLF